MKNIFKSEKGVSLITLAIAVIIMILLTNILVYNTKDNLQIEKLRNMQNDIANLKDKVDEYYATYGTIPIIKEQNPEAYGDNEYTEIVAINNAGLISEAVDTGKFYVIDLSALENLTLNYGKDYEKITESTYSVNGLKDIYIINEKSFNIFYVKGIEVDGKMYYTNYMSEDVDNKEVHIRYEAGAPIPEGFYYIGGTLEDGIVISDVKDDDMDYGQKGNQFVWIPVEDKKDYVRKYFENIKVTNDTNCLPEGIGSEVEAVINAGGFYVGRYETGDSSATDRRNSETEGTIAIREDQEVYNYISQQDAKEKAKTLVNNDSVKSALISGTQWDVVMDTIDKKIDSYDVNSAKQGNHVGWITWTGSGEIVYNIADLEGNVKEYTAEKIDGNANGKYIARGGDYNTVISASSGTVNNGEANEQTGFRIVLYVNVPNPPATYDRTGKYKDENMDEAYIPEGFRVSGLKSEQKIDNGLVIYDIPRGTNVNWLEDSDENGVLDVQENYNQFVWVPVNNFYDFIRVMGYTDGEKDWGTISTIEMKSGVYYEPQGDGIANTTEAEKLYRSVKENKGFYIGRYEAGNVETSVVVKRNVKVYNDIQYEGEDGKKGAFELAQNFDLDNEYTSVTSTLCYGVQWDAALNFIDPNYITNRDAEGNPSCRETSYVRNSTGKGNYSEVVNKNEWRGKVVETGKIEDYAVNNIYDMAGNICEWTMESYGTRNGVIRGGYRHYSGVNCPASVRDFGTDSDYDMGFRIALFLES